MPSTNTGFKGIDIRQSGNQLVFRIMLHDASGVIVTSGTVTARLYELQSDGTLKSYDFADNTFKSTTLTTETLALTHRPGNNGATPTGIWTAALSTLTGFTAGGIYFTQITCSTATPSVKSREWQYGSVQGDAALTADGLMASDMQRVQRTTQTAKDLGLALPAVAPGGKGGLPITDASTGLILTGYGGGTMKGDLVDAPNSTALAAFKTALTGMGTYMTGILATALTETSGYLAAGFKKFFNVATPANDMNSLALDSTVLKASSTIDGSFTVALTLKELLAKASGNPTKVGDAYTYHDKATNAALFTLTIVGDQVTRS